MKNKYDILVIDDEQVVIDAIKLVAKFEGYTVDFVMDASMAIYNISNNSYKIIVCDIMMPVMNGFEFLQLLKEKGYKIPVVMTTGYTTIENAVRSLNNGAIAFIPKPFTFDEVNAVITRCINYCDILEKFSQGTTNEVYFVPCPPKYLRLGYGFWSNKLDDGSVLIGVSDLFVKSIKSSKKVELYDVETVINQSLTCAKITGENDLIHNVLAPLSGKIIEKNEELVNNPVLLEKDPYFKAWLYKIIPSDYLTEIKFLTNCQIENYMNK